MTTFFYSKGVDQMQKDLVKLIDATKEHLEIIFNWRNKAFIREVMYNSDLLRWEEHVNWFDKVYTDNSRIVKVLYYNNIPYGSANFCITNEESNVGEWGFYIGEENAPKGMGTLLAYMMLSFLFEELKVRKVCAEIIEFNTISIKFHEKIGFKNEGILRKHIYKNGHYCDIYLYSIFAEEWSAIKLGREKDIFE